MTTTPSEQPRHAVVLIPCGDLEAMKHTYASKRKMSHGMALVRSYPRRKVTTLPAWLLRWCSGHHAPLQLVTGETRVRFRLGATCSSFHMRCVSKVKLHSCLLSDIYLYLFYVFPGFENISCYIFQTCPGTASVYVDI